MMVTGDYCAKVCRVLQLCSSLVVTVPRCVVYYNYDGHWWLLCQGVSCITIMMVTGGYCAKVCRVLQL